MLRSVAFVLAMFAANYAFAQSQTPCPNMEIRALEQKAGQPRAWTAIFDLGGNVFSATLGAQKRNADLVATCSGKNAQVSQRNATDGDNCNYAFQVVGEPKEGATVIAQAACPSGPVQIRSAKLFESSGEILTEGRILAILHTADDLAQRFALIEAGLTNNADIRDFAQTMADDHKDLNAAVEQTAQKAGIKLAPSEYSRILDKMGARRRADMVKVIGPRADKAYVQTEILFHQRMLATFDQLLIPNAKSDEVKRVLQLGREVFARHEHHAMESAPIFDIPAKAIHSKAYYFCQPGSGDRC